MEQQGGCERASHIQVSTYPLGHDLIVYVLLFSWGIINDLTNLTTETSFPSVGAYNYSIHSKFIAMACNNG